MKYNIRVNQKAIIENGFEIDLIEAILLDFVFDFVNSGAVVSINEAGTTFFWISHSKVSEELPILKMAKNSIYKRMKSLCDKGFLIQSENSQNFGRSFYAISEKTKKIIYTENKVGKPSEATDENPKATDENPKTTDESQNDNNIKNNNNNNNKLLFPKGNSISKKKKEVKKDNLNKCEIYKDAVSVYFQFFKKRNGIKPKFDGADGKALKQVISYFKGIYKDKDEDVSEKEFVLNSLEYIFEHWEKQVDFIRNQTKMTQINSNLNNIINKLRNGKASYKKGRNERNKINGKSRPFTVDDFI